jgi:polyhydroxyalkanoate synthesis regulator phasin
MINDKKYTILKEKVNMTELNERVTHLEERIKKLESLNNNKASITPSTYQWKI